MSCKREAGDLARGSFIDDILLIDITNTRPNVDQGWRSGESTRLPPMWPGIRRRMWVFCNWFSYSAPRDFSPLIEKPTFDLICSVNLHADCILPN